MNCKIEIVPRLLHFKQPAGTSRGVYTTRKVWYVHFTSPEFPGRVGVGECAPLPKLSCDDLPDYGKRLADVCRWVEEQGGKLDGEALRDYPSILDWRLLSGTFLKVLGLYGIQLSHVERQVFL